MEGRYEILLNEDKVGRVVVQRQGLYYRFDCRCAKNTGEIYRIMLDMDGKIFNLGVPIPSSDGLWLVTKRPIKDFGNAEPKFYLMLRLPEGPFVPVFPDEPFAYLDRLKNAYMQVRDGMVGVVISAQGQPGNGPNP